VLHESGAIDREENGLAKIAKDLAAERTLAHVADVSNSDAVDKMVATVVKRFGRLDVLVNNAGVHEGGEPGDITDDQWRKVLQGSVVAVAVDGKHRFSKSPRLSVVLTTGLGVEGDAHYGAFVRHLYLARRNPRAPNLRQVHLMPSQLFDALRNSGFDVSPGDLGENITTAGLDLETLPLNTELRIGPSANIRLTGLRTPCVLIDRFKSRLRGRLFDATPNPPFRAGVMAVVAEGGEISPGDPIRAILPERPHLPLPPL
jgi:MOSC domain-containing protein YiiM